jgi:hypothetical protein
MSAPPAAQRKIAIDVNGKLWLGADIPEHLMTDLMKRKRGVA